MRNPCPIATFFSFFILIVSLSCKKSVSEPPIPPVIVKTDTLTAGWSKIKAGSGALGDIFFQNNLVGYATGPDAGTLKSSDGGLTWNPVFSGGSNLSVTPDGKVFLVKPGASGPFNGHVYRSVNGGASFDSISNGSGILQDIFFTGNDTGYAVTSAGNIARTTNGGLTWPITSAVGAGSFAGYSSLFFLNNANGWVAMGERHMAYRTNSGINNWINAVFDSLNVVPGSVFAASTQIIYVGDAYGKIYKSIDGGLNYSRIKNCDQNSFVDVHFINTNIGYACCGEKIYKTSDGGSSWQTVVTIVNARIIEIHFTDASHGWACGSNGLILRYSL